MIHGPAQVLHLQPEQRAGPRRPPGRMCRSLPGVWLHGRRLPEGHAAEHHEDPVVGRTGETHWAAAAVAAGAPEVRGLVVVVVVVTTQTRKESP